MREMQLNHVVGNSRGYFWPKYYNNCLSRFYNKINLVFWELLAINGIDFQKPFSSIYTDPGDMFIASLVEIHQVAYFPLQHRHKFRKTHFLISGDPKTNISSKNIKNNSYSSKRKIIL